MIYQQKLVGAMTLSLLALVFSLQPVAADDDPAGEGDPVDVSEPIRTARISTDTYRSDTLEADFLTEWMRITQNGTSYTFWGARITSMDPSSPLKALGVRNGDVITRLDGLKISRNMKKVRGIWQLPELERHFGRTEVRYIISGTSRVRIGDIVIDGSSGSGGGGTPVAP